jgi:hypothetical protein
MNLPTQKVINNIDHRAQPPLAATYDNLRQIRRYVERAFAKLLWGELPHPLRCQAPREPPKRRRWSDSR